MIFKLVIASVIIANTLAYDYYYNDSRVCKYFGIQPEISLLTDIPAKNIELVKIVSRATFSNQVLADLAVAQAILESNLYGKPSSLARQYNNLFGIKGEGTNGSADCGTKEHVNGKVVKTSAKFAVNRTLGDSFVQYKKVLDLPRYKAVREAKTFEEAAIAVKRAGYATDVNYTKKLIDIYKVYIDVR